MAVYTQLDNPELYFQCKLHTGNATARSITLDGDENMQPDFVWIKQRSGSNNHELFDAVRGATKRMYSDVANAEDTHAQTLTSFDSDGFSLGTGNPNNNSATYVSWCWKESADAGFDIVSYTGNGSNRTLSHGLSQKPDMIIIKRRNTTGNWTVYHSTLTVSKYIYLHLTNAADTGGASSYWQTSEPTSSVVSLGTDGDVNGSSDTYISYFFCNKQGYSKFGSYTGNGNADGTFIYTGFKPAFVITKKTSGTSPWGIHDNKRDPFNEVDELLEADTDAALSDSTYGKDFLSNGFKIRTSSSGVNGSGDTFVYMAFAEAPFVNSKGVPCNAR